MALAPSAVNSPSSIAESRTLAGQKAMPTSMIRAEESVFMAEIPFLAQSRLADVSHGLRTVVRLNYCVC